MKKRASIFSRSSWELPAETTASALADHPEGKWKVSFLYNLGHGDDAELAPCNPRLEFVDKASWAGAKTALPYYLGFLRAASSWAVGEEAFGV
jgi:hypothetical protein